MSQNWSGFKVAPCPWCGGREIQFQEIQPKTWAGVCPDCHAIGPYQSPQGLLTALDKWNDKRKVQP